MRRTRAFLLMLLAPLFAACGSAGPEGGQASAAPDSVALAAALFDPDVYDTITWQTHSAALQRGAVVFAHSCSRCHGMVGEGGGVYAVTHQLAVPSLRRPDWPAGEDVPAVRRLVFTGTADGMPHWGLHGLKARDVDAVARYIATGLRAGEYGGS
jgi:mono/diheme cytochrome c family protein